MAIIKEFYEWYRPGLYQQVGMAAACMMCFILYGIEQGVLANVSNQARFLNQFGNPDSALLGIIVSIYTLGSFFGCLCDTYIGERLGRKRTIWLGLFFILIGVILQTTAYTTAHLMVGRFVTGLGTGIETSTTPMYQSEVCTAENRGKLVSAEPMFVAFGIVVSYWVGYGLSFADGQVSWRFPLAFQLVFIIVSALLFLGCPESPRYLVNKNRVDEAQHVLARIQGKAFDHPDVIRVKNEIVETREIEEEGSGISWKVILQGKDPVKSGYRILLAWGVMCMQQLGGVNLVVYYMPFVLEHNVGLDPNLSSILGGCINIMYMLGALIPSFFLDRMGRRPSMIIGCIVMSFCMLIITILLSLDTKNTSIGATAFFFVFIFAFGSSMNCCGWVYVPEILPLQIRSKGMAIGVSSNWLWNFFIAMITPVVTTNIGWKTYIIFTITNAVSAVIIYFFYPETNRKTLEEIDFIFLGKNVSDMRKQTGTLPTEKKESQHVEVIEISA